MVVMVVMVVMEVALTLKVVIVAAVVVMSLLAVVVAVVVVMLVVVMLSVGVSLVVVVVTSNIVVDMNPHTVYVFDVFDIDVREDNRPPYEAPPTSCEPAKIINEIYHIIILETSLPDLLVY